MNSCASFDQRHRILRHQSWRQALLTSCAALSTLVASNTGVSAQTVIDTAETTTQTDSADGETIIVTETGSVTTTPNDEYGIQSDDTNVTITNSGSIETLGGNAYGIYSTGANATITNSGSIETQGALAYGIYSTGTDATITNSGSMSTQDSSGHGIRSRGADAVITNGGSIETLGTNAYGIFSSGGNATITNSGSIETQGDAAFGIFSSGTDATITNSGSIETQSNNAFGIYSTRDDATITNSGSIETLGDRAYGIYSTGANATITNSGSIKTQGDDGYGVYSTVDRATITNFGTISTQGSDAHGVYSTGDNATITNSGMIVSSQSQSIRFTEPGGILNLLPGSFLGGVVQLDNTGTSVNITTGPSHSTVTSFHSSGVFTGGSPTFLGPVPGFFNASDNLTATYDPTVLSQAAGLTQDLANGISGQITGRFTPSGSTSSRFASAFAQDDTSNAEEPFEALVGTYNPITGSRHGVWMAGFGGFSSDDGNEATLDTDSWSAGLSVGYDRVISPAWTLGVLGGYSMAAMEADSQWVDNAVDHEARGGYAGIYGRYAPAPLGWHGDGALLLGFLNHENTRFVNDNLAVGGVSSASSDYSSWWIAPEVSVGYSYALSSAPAWTLTPSTRVRLAVQTFEGYTETGPSTANATVGQRTSASLQTRLQMAATYTGYEHMVLTGRMGADASLDVGEDSVTMTLIGVTQSMPTFVDDEITGFIGADAQLALSEATSLQLGSELSFGDGHLGGRVSAELRFTF